MNKAELYSEQFDHQWIARFGVCRAELEESGNIVMQNLYLVGLWGFLLGKGLRVDLITGSDTPGIIH